MKTIIPVILLHISVVLLGQYTLKVHVAGVKSNQGFVLAGIWNNPKDYMDAEKKMKGEAVKSKLGNVTIEVDSLPAGDYAIVIFHDENGNFELDRNFLGIPKEPYAFYSKDDPKLGPPDWNDAAIKVPETKEIRMKLFEW
ncbi:MAG: DUF2141 domain-containing protein [Bacteroidales bacterium]|nr:DUF2141 domain-containing protein [Bacteroidales bacterium]